MIKNGVGFVDYKKVTLIRVTSQDYYKIKKDY